MNDTEQHEPTPEADDKLLFGAIEPAPDIDAQEQSWADRLGAIRDEMSCLGYASVFLYCAHDRMEQEDRGTTWAYS